MQSQDPSQMSRVTAARYHGIENCGATSSRTVPKTQPLQVAFSLREGVDLRFQKEGILGRNIAWGRVGRTRQKEEKRMHKKGGSVSVYVLQN